MDMPNNNGKNEKNLNASSQNSGAAARRQLRAQKLKAKKQSSKKTYRVVNSGKFEHLRKQVASFKKTRDEYIRMQNRKTAQAMAQQNNEPKPESVIEQVNQQKPETEIENENTVVIEEPKDKEVSQNEVAEEKDLETLNLEDIKIDEADLADPALDEELEKLEQKMKKEEELKAQGIDPESVEYLDDPELEEELKELAQDTEEKLEGETLEEALQKLSNEVEGEINDHHAFDLEVSDPIVDEEINRLEREIAAEVKVNNAPENEEEAPKEEQMENKGNAEIKLDEITVIQEEKQKEPTLANDFEFTNGPEAFDIDDDNLINYEALNNKDVVSDEPQSEPLYSVSELIEMRIANPDIYENVNSQLTDILKSAGSILADNPRAVGVIHDIMAKTMFSAFDPDRENVEMSDVATAFFKNAYNGIYGEDWSLKDKAMNAQKIADLMLKNYSPIPIIGEELQGFADNYVLKNKGLFAALQNIGYNEIDSVFEEVQKELAGGIENKEQEIKNKENVDIQFDEIIEIEEEKQKEPALADDFEFSTVQENTVEDTVQEVTDFNQWLEEQIGTSDVQRRVEIELTEIFKASGITNQNEIADLVDLTQTYIPKTIAVNSDLDGDNPDMHNIAVTFFDDCYKTLVWANIAPKEKIETAQRVADVMLRNYSPIAFSGSTLDQYADRYVTRDKALLRERLEQIEYQDVDELLGEEAEVISDVPKNEQPEQPVASDEERKEREIAFAKQGLEELSQHRGGLTEDKRDRENLSAYYQGILDKYKTDEEWYNESLTQAEQKRQEQRERDAREIELKEQAENSGIRDIIEDEVNRDAVAGEENDTNLPTDENPKQEAIYIPDFYDRLNERFDNNDVTKLVMSELKAIIKSAGIEDQQTASDIAELVYFNVAEGLKTSYVEGGFRPKTRDAVESCFDNADTALKLRDDTGLNLEERLVAAQRITNVMFKNYSVVTFADHKLDYYAEDYVLKDDELLRKQLSDHYKISQDQIEPMMQDIRAKLEGHAVNRQAEPDAVLNPEVKENNAQEMALKQEPAPKQNAQVQNTMDDLIGDDGLMDGSKPDAFERKLAEQKAKEEQAKKAQEEKVQGQPTIVNALEDDGLMDGSQPDAFERKLAEQEAKEAVKKEAEKKAAEEAAKKAAKEAQKLEEAKQRENSVRANVFINNLKTFNGMYKVNLEPNNFALTVSDAWTLIRSGDDKKKAEGQKMLGELFKSAIKPAFEIEKHASYNEHRLPDYTEIAKSANELLRSAMYGFTDMYHSPDTKNLFEATAFGGLNAKDIVALTEGESRWSMDQKSDEAWEIQSKDAKNLADKWLSGDKPYEKMISEMKALAKADKDGVVDRNEILTKLTAAEWLLVNNDKMMIDDPEDPLNKLPNWGNRYWKALTEAREALGIDKHTSMRDLIQSDYAASAKAVISSAYNEAQIEDYVLDSAAREIYDSMEIQKEQFAIQSAAVTLTDSQIDKNAEEIEMTGVRFPHPVPELDERTIMQHQPKNYDFVIEPQTELNLTAKNQTQAK